MLSSHPSGTPSQVSVTSPNHSPTPRWQLKEGTKHTISKKTDPMISLLARKQRPRYSNRKQYYECPSHTDPITYVLKVSQTMMTQGWTDTRNLLPRERSASIPLPRVTIDPMQPKEHDPRCHRAWLSISRLFQPCLSRWKRVFAVAENNDTDLDASSIEAVCGFFWSCSHR